MMVTAAKTTTIPEPKLFVSHLIFIQLILIMLNEYFVNKTIVHYTGDHFSTSICWIHCIDQPKNINFVVKIQFLIMKP